MMMNSPNSTSLVEGRYFIALLPPPEIATELETHKIYCAEKFNSKASLRSPAHLTLIMPFLWKEKKESMLTEKLSAFCASENPFAVTLENFASFTPRVIYAQVLADEALLGFQQRLARYVKQTFYLLHPNRYDLPWHPHITIAFRDLKKEVFPLAHTHFQKQKLNCSWVVKQAVLLKQNNKVWIPHAQFNFA
jgi:2'-5' RNA ligase